MINLARCEAVNAAMSSKRGKVGRLNGATRIFAMTNEDSCLSLRNATAP